MCDFVSHEARGRMWYEPKLVIEGFHVTSYQSNFASHHVRDRHVGFLFARSGIGKYKKISRYFLFSSYHNTKLQLSDKNINQHTYSVEILTPSTK